MHALFNEFYLIVLSIFFLGKGTENLQMNRLSLGNSWFFLPLYENALGLMEGGLLTENLVVLTGFKKEKCIFILVFSEYMCYMYDVFVLVNVSMVPHLVFEMASLTDPKAH